MLLSVVAVGAGPPSQSIVWPQPAALYIPWEEKNMPTEYFEQRERALLGQRYEQLYAACSRRQSAALPYRRCAPRRSSLRRGQISRWSPRPSARRLLWCISRTLSPDGIRITMRVCSIRRSPRLLRQRRCWGTAGDAGAGSVRRTRRQKQPAGGGAAGPGCAGEQRIRCSSCRYPEKQSGTAWACPMQWC